MRAYRRGWWTVVGVGAVLTWPLALLGYPPASLVVFGIVAAVLAATLALVTVSDDAATAERLRFAGLCSIAGAASSMSLLGLGSVLGATCLLVALLVAASSPFVVERLVVRRLRMQDEARAAELPAEEQVPDAQPRVPVTELSTTELVHAWRASFPSLLRAQTTASVNSRVARRQQYLDELERRDPVGLRRWLESGARAAGDPTRFLRGNDGGASASGAA